MRPQRLSVSTYTKMSAVCGPRVRSRTTCSIEPLHQCSFPVAFGYDDNFGSLRQLRRMDRSGSVHGVNAERLQSFSRADCVADNARSLMSGLKAIAAETSHVQENGG